MSSFGELPARKGSLKYIVDKNSMYLNANLKNDLDII